jgi:hypothetical protein
MRRYMVTVLASVTDEVKYTVSCEVTGTPYTTVNLGTAVTGNSGIAVTVPRCCGSSTLTPGAKLEATGLFQRSAVAAMLSISGGVAAAKYPPSPVRDLFAGLENPLYYFTDDEDPSGKNQTFQLYFTAPGDRLDTGAVRTINIFFAAEYALLQTINPLSPPEKLNASLELLDPTPLDSPPEFGQPVRLDVRVMSAASGGRFTVGQEYYFRLMMLGSNGAAYSNIARLYLWPSTDPDALRGLSGMSITAIVIGVLLLVPAVLGRARDWLDGHFFMQSIIFGIVFFLVEKLGSSKNLLYINQRLLKVLNYLRSSYHVVFGKFKTCVYSIV